MIPLQLARKIQICLRIRHTRSPWKSYCCVGGRLGTRARSSIGLAGSETMPAPEPMVESCSITAELHCDAGVDAFAMCKQPASGRIESGIRRVNHKTPTAPTLHRQN